MTKESFRSKFEKTINTLIKRYKNIRFKYEDKTEKMPYTVEHLYLPDFVLTNKAGTRKIYLECKGWFRPSDRTKMDRVIKCNPDSDIRFVFMQDNYLTKSKKNRYSDWCKQRKVPYTFKKIPKEWIDELRD